MLMVGYLAVKAALIASSRVFPPSSEYPGSQTVSVTGEAGGNGNSAGVEPAVSEVAAGVGELGVVVGVDEGELLQPVATRPTKPRAAIRLDRLPNIIGSP
jgi:hypothetical protein